MSSSSQSSQTPTTTTSSSTVTSFRPPRWLALAVLVVALVYGLSPVDVLPEALLGPLGLADDVGVGGFALWLLYHAFSPSSKKS